MKRVIIICEGDTEKEFCGKILSPYLAAKSIYIQFPLIKKTMGGIVKWPELKKQILLHLKTEPKVYVTTLIDYYGLHTKHDFPEWATAGLQPDKSRRMEILEAGMKSDIDAASRFRFIPYIQLHEFEGLLFNDIRVFYEQVPANELVGLEELKSTFAQYQNPEMINDNRDTSPSHRLRRIIRGYNKLVYGTILAEAIGLERMRKKSPRFNAWLNKLEQLE
jgi:hypothetical protein